VRSRFGRESPIIEVGELSDEERRLLLALARRTLVAATGGDPAVPIPLTPTLRTACGAFVTLRREGELRGCIGHLAADRALAETVARMVVSAAQEDLRFPPVTAAEVPALQIEISVLTEPMPLPECDPTLVRPGQDGVIVRCGRAQGVLLPQVATEFGWDGEGLLAAACRKAGLTADAWRRPGTEVLVFQVDAFTE
jgi:AmmeMemoRadiSam system protein A